MAGDPLPCGGVTMAATGFSVLFFLSLIVNGYLFGRFRERIFIDDLHAGLIPAFCCISCAVVARNLGAAWWWIPLAQPASFVAGYCFTVAVGIGTRRVGRRVLIIQGEKDR